MNLARVALALLCAAAPILGANAVPAQDLPIQQVLSALQPGASNTVNEALISPMPIRTPDFGYIESIDRELFPAEKRRVSDGDMARARQLSGEACQYIRLLRYAEAEELLREALKVAPGLANAHSNLGFLFNKTGRPKQAVPHLEYAVRCAPDQPAPLVTLAGAYQLLGQFDEAITTYQMYLSRFPGTPDREFIRDIVSRLQAEHHRTANIKSGNRQNSDDYLSFSNHNGILVWPKSTLKVYIAPAVGVRGYRPELHHLLKEAFMTWQSAGTVKFEFVDSSHGCDIDCSWVDNPYRLSSPGEGGEAIMSYDRHYLRHCRIVLLTKRTADDSIIGDNEMMALCLHEIGHSLGLAEHSPNPDDVMFCTILSTNSKPTLSSRDLLTLQHLYSNLKPRLTQLTVE